MPYLKYKLHQTVFFLFLNQRKWVSCMKATPASVKQESEPAFCLHQAFSKLSLQADTSFNECLSEFAPAPGRWRQPVPWKSPKSVFLFLWRKWRNPWSVSCLSFQADSSLRKTKAFSTESYFRKSLKAIHMNSTPSVDTLHSEALLRI